MEQIVITAKVFVTSIRCRLQIFYGNICEHASLRNFRKRILEKKKKIYKYVVHPYIVGYISV